MNLENKHPYTKRSADEIVEEWAEATSLIPIFDELGFQRNDTLGYAAITKMLPDGDSLTIDLVLVLFNKHQAREFLESEVEQFCE